VLHPLRWARRAIAVLLCVVVGVLDQQAFQWVPFLQGLSSNGLGRALLLFVTGLVAGFLLRSWWALGLVPLAYLVGFEVTSDVASGSFAGTTDAYHLLRLLQAAGGPALLVLVGAGLATVIIRGFPWRRRRPRERPRPPSSATTGGSTVGAPARPGAGQTPGPGR
jgi:hypothetical protein